MDEHDTAQRTRTITWDDPRATSEAGRAMSGRQVLQAIAEGTLPAVPIATLLGMRLIEIGEGRVVWEAEPAEYHYNPHGMVHGGLAATLLDSAMGCAVNSLLPAGTTYTTLEIKVNYIRPITSATGTIHAEGTVIHLGGRTATAQGQITDGAGKLLAHATTTCLIFRPLPPDPSPARREGAGP